MEAQAAEKAIGKAAGKVGGRNIAQGGHGIRFNALEMRRYTAEEIRQQNVTYQQRSRKRAKLKKLGEEVDKYLEEYKFKASAMEYRRARQRRLACLRLPYAWTDKELQTAMEALRKLKLELKSNLYGEGAPEPSELALKMVSLMEKSQESWEVKLDALQSVLDYVGRCLELVPIDKLPLTQALVTCALAHKLPNLPETFAPVFKKRLALILPIKTYDLLMEGVQSEERSKENAMIQQAYEDDINGDRDIDAGFMNFLYSGGK